MNKKILLGVVMMTVLIFSGCSLGQKPADIGQEEAKSKALKFVTENLVQPGTKLEIKEVIKEGELYKITLDVSGEEIIAYMTSDGKKFFPQVMDMAEVEKQLADQKVEDEAAAKNVPKAEKPAVDLYVMSFCPYGNKAEDTMKPVYDLLKNKVDFNFHYIVSSSGDTIDSLHGQKEVDQNEREACVLREYGKDLWMNFVTYVNKNCGSDGSCWEDGAKAGNIDAAKISACVKSSGVAFMKADEELSNNAGATGSPTMIINGANSKAVYKYGNSEEYKKAICNAFNEMPSECAQELSSENSVAEGGSCS